MIAMHLWQQTSSVRHRSAYLAQFSVNFELFGSEAAKQAGSSRSVRSAGTVDSTQLRVDDFYPTVPSTEFGGPNWGRVEHVLQSVRKKDKPTVWSENRHLPSSQS